VRRTRSAKILRLGAAVLALVMLGSMGLVMWRQQSFEDAVRSAGSEISELIRTSDRIAARERLNHWVSVLGDCEEADDLRRQVDFADAAELQRQTRQAHRRMRKRLDDAAEMLESGELRSALAIYSEVRENEDLRSTVDEVIATRLDAVLADIEETAKIMRTRLPEEPTAMLDRRDLGAHLADIKSLCRPTMYVVVDDIATLIDNDELPRYLSRARRQNIVGVLDRVRDIFTRSRQLSEAYATALRRSETQRRFDPLFKKALRREEAYDFTGALELFRELQKSEATDPELRALFRDHVNRNATICKLMNALSGATNQGDFSGAQQQLRALELAFPDVPFDRMIRLPLRIESQPSGARVHCNGTEIGVTPCTVAFVPADPNRVVVDMAGFRPHETAVEGEYRGPLFVPLVFEPLHSLEHPNAVDVGPVRDDHGRMFLVDRGGNVSSIVMETGERLWSYRTQDLSGLLSRAFLHRDHVIFASLDGDLRALEVKTGSVAWTVPDLPTETAPLQFGQFLAIATTNDRIHVIDLEARSQASAPLAIGGRARLERSGNNLIVITQKKVMALRMPHMRMLWEEKAEGLSELHAVSNDTCVVVVDDNGVVTCLETEDGKQRWRQAGDAELLGPPIFDGDSVIMTSAQRIVRLALVDGSRRRTIPASKGEWNGASLLVGTRLMTPSTSGYVEVMDAATGKRLYLIEGSKRGVRVLPCKEGSVVALPDRRLHFYPKLR